MAKLMDDPFFGDSTEIKASEALHIDFEKELNEKQLEAINITQGPQLIIAGAGTGKTRTLTYKLAKLISEGISPSRILLLTFTNKAAKEMLERAQEMLKGTKDCSQVAASTYHSFCARILRQNASIIGLQQNFNIITPSNAASIFTDLREESGFKKDKDFPTGKNLAAILSYSVNKEIELKDVINLKFPKFDEYTEDIEALCKKFKEYKKEKNLVDYDDLLVLTIELFDINQNICHFLSNMYQYIMVDEYQDSNALQLRLLKQLRQFDNKNICVVGDDQQSIYGFRGSNFKNIMNFPLEFPDCHLTILEENYRSTQGILDLANAILNNAAEKYPKELTAVNGGIEKPKLVCVSTSFDEAKFVFQQIVRKHAAGKPLRDMAVLVRNGKNSMQLESIITEQYKTYPIDFKKFGGPKLMDKESVQDVIAFLSVINNVKSADFYWSRILKLYPNIGGVYAKIVIDAVREKGLSALISPSFTKKAFGKHLPELKDVIEKGKEMKFPDLMTYILDYWKKLKLSTLKEAKKAESKKIEERRVISNDYSEMKILDEAAENYTSISSFLETFLLDPGEEDENKDYLTISTIHSAKGLEFDTVFILDCIDENFPGERELVNSTPLGIKEHKEEIEESRRLLYVAVTRAKKELYLMFPSALSVFRIYMPASLSRFLKEDYIDDDYTEKIYWK